MTARDRLGQRGAEQRITTLTAERNALRKALQRCQRISAPWSGDHNNSLGAYEACDQIDAIARTALGAQGKRPKRRLPRKGE